MSLSRAACLCCARRLTAVHRSNGSLGCTTALVTALRSVHERPFFELPHDPARGEAYEVARDALLQLNIMTRRGIEPDALMYTSLIDIMGRAGLEWQAYKLFSRMIEGNIRPLPETYVALRNATAKHRTKLRDEIQTKIEESISTFPEELAEGELERRREEDRQCAAKFEDYMRGELPPPLPFNSAVSPRQSSSADTGPGAAMTTGDGGRVASASVKGDSSMSEPVMTMKIRNPTDAWTTAQHAEEVRGQPQQLARGDSVGDLRAALSRMHEEELRIYLSAHRQLRHGNKEALIDRILENISEQRIRAMLGRRKHYFRSVEQILAADLEELKSAPMSSPSLPAISMQKNLHAGEADRTMTKAETKSTAPEVLQTPWGIIRKPLKYREDRTMSAHESHTKPGEGAMGRLEKVRLTAPELFLIRRKAESNDLDELPESLLRRYAYQFRLHWRRRDPLSLVNAVSWHATTFLVPNSRDTAEGEEESQNAVTVPPPTPAIRMQKEKEGMQQTLENFEAFRIISQRTNNLQVVDDKEINLHLKRVRRDALRRERKTEEELRRESNILAAAGLAASAKSYTSPPDERSDAEGGTHVLGWEGREDDPSSVAALEDVASASTDVPLDESNHQSAPLDELPPWELTAGEEEFNLSTGRFGDPDVGHYQELSDSTIRVLPSRAAQKQWSVDRHLLPDNLRDVVARAELEQLRYRESVEEEYTRRRQYAKYRKWDNMIQKAAKRKEEAATGDGGGEGDESRPVRPLPAKKRLAQLLRQGAAKQKVSAAVKEKFNREL